MTLFSKRHNKISAFTLAEVLITLGIIGIVANMTIPSLVASTEKQQYVTRLKKAYSSINQVLITFASDNGCIGDLRCTGVFNSDKTQATLGDALTPYFKVTKNCGVQGVGCFPNLMSTKYDVQNNGIAISDNQWYYTFITADGTSIGLSNGQNGCGSDYRANKAIPSPVSQICAFLMVDVNGLKGPNRYGRDLFAFNITNGKGPLLYPDGGTDLIDSKSYARGTYCRTTDTYGSACAGRIMENGWQMDY